MRNVLFTLLTGAVLLSAAADLRAQQRPVLSPRDSVTLTLDTNVISVNYGRPSMRGRKIMGQLVPWNQVWRTGANQATHLRNNFDMTMGGVPVLRGRYTLWTLPSPGGWKVIINKQTGQWGTAYDPSQDLARFDAKVEQLGIAVDTMRISLQSTGMASGILSILWENTSVQVPFEKNDHLRPISPNDSVRVTLGGRSLELKYSRPYVRGRMIWGGVVPYDSVWRTGANNATSLVTDGAFTIGGVVVPKGSYTLYTIPQANTVTLIISKKPGGNQPDYDPKMDLARISMKGESSPRTIDPFRIWIDPLDKSSATLRIGWADKAYSTVVKAG